MSSPSARESRRTVAATATPVKSRSTVPAAGNQRIARTRPPPAEFQRYSPRAARKRERVRASQIQ
ncbi:hypothetical protein [Glycomyces paridis]|uniref:Uncharacterized protein n=1 Tax=Glycomyces paridis TaxID=2126555 RepID=A0A4S8PF89_9ACTN|nr:hypothetical protein [Glycomyces paridis]THV27982.1 hypothetical protein E9998_13425 [Glycomyces paridis]